MTVDLEKVFKVQDIWAKDSSSSTLERGRQQLEHGLCELSKAELKEIQRMDIPTEDCDALRKAFLNGQGNLEFLKWDTPCLLIASYHLLALNSLNLDEIKNIFPFATLLFLLETVQHYCDCVAKVSEKPISEPSEIVSTEGGPSAKSGQEAVQRFGSNEKPDWAKESPLRTVFPHLKPEEWASFQKKVIDLGSEASYYTVCHSIAQENDSPILASIHGQFGLSFRMKSNDYEQGALPQGKEVFVVPSFSMLQAYLDTLSESTDRGSSLSLIPSCGSLSEEDISDTSMVGSSVIGLDLPLLHPERKPGRNNAFMEKTDGFPKTSSPAFTVHDFYHAFRRMAQSSTEFRKIHVCARIIKQFPTQIEEGTIIPEMTDKSEAILAAQRSANALIDGELPCESTHLAFQSIIEGAGIYMNLFETLIAHLPVQNKVDGITVVDVLLGLQNIVPGIQSNDPAILGMQRDLEQFNKELCDD